MCVAAAFVTDFVVPCFHSQTGWGGERGRIVFVNKFSLLSPTSFCFFQFHFLAVAFVATFHAITSRVIVCLVSENAACCGEGVRAVWGALCGLDGPRQCSSTCPLSPWMRRGG